jgi:23S rRNA (cytosine1962-C5)-methyltransferase
MIKTIQLRRGKTESLRRFHPWIFSGAIARTEGNIEDGEIVRVVDEQGQFLALGHFQIGSIAVRVLSFTDRAIDENFWMERIGQAFTLRRSLGLCGNPENDIFRLIHGEGDQLPGLVVDVYGETAVMQAHSVGMHLCRETIADAIIAASDGIIKNIYYKSETTLPYKAGLQQENGFLRGGNPENIATEYGLKFHIDWLRGQKTGFFVDQRENRKLLEFYAKGRRVLNMFCYTGGFSVYALRGGAQLVHSVDSSAKAIDLTEKNAELNFPNDSRHQAFAEDAFKYLDRADSQYDLIVLDPPAFAKHKDALRNALKGYTRLNAIAFEKIRPGGILFTFSCSQAVNKDQFRLAVFTAAAQSGRHVRILHQLHQPADHPINIYHPEGEYLKGLVLYVE